MQAHDAEISVESVPHVKTEFPIFLPRSDKAVWPSKEILTELADSGNERSLPVDDENIILDVIRKTLIQLGYRVDTDISSHSALAAFQNTPDEYDLVITDMTTLGMTDYKLLDEIARMKSNIPIILCSGYNEKFDRELLLGVRV